nr:hypothetical protein [Tanacetum cinerariifolium]
GRWKKENGVVLCPRQWKAEEEKECWLWQRKTGLRSFWSLVSAFFNPDPGSFAHRRIRDPEINSDFQDNTLRA